MAGPSSAAPRPSARVVVIGGGLAGMTAARELAERGVRPLLLEASTRLGGKAGAEQENGIRLDHGYHVFPGWYANTRRLLEELGLSPHLIDIERVHYVKPGQFPRLCTLHSMTSPRHLWANLRAGLVPWHDAILASYFALDLASTSFDQRSYLDRVSANGYLRSRLYATDGVARAHHHFVLQAASIPNYEMSAMTAKRITASWFRVPNPIFSILDGDLQSRFIDPFTRCNEKLGVETRLEQRVAGFDLEGCRVARVRLAGAEPIALGPRDAVVLTTPHGVTTDLVDDALFTAERAAAPNEDEKLLSHLVHLRSAPMAAFHVFFQGRVPGIPKEHTVLLDTPAELSFVDISQHWSGFDTTVLSCIASDFAPLARLSAEAMQAHLVRELIGALNGAVSERDVDWSRTCVFANVATPLFLNTVGAWSYRPNTKTRLANLYVAGDWCRTGVDLTTMEGAVASGQATAAHVLRSLGIARARQPIEIPHWPDWLLRAAALAGLPAVLALRGALWARERLAAAR
ncbi:MAG TPA: FAD-dependent oxidoreductase [Myxococcota bacterium]|nr:FAD-dependent oxidoreductase [Myxococcota bacterium]